MMDNKEIKIALVKLYEMDAVGVRCLVCDRDTKKVFEISKKEDPEEKVICHICPDCTIQKKVQEALSKEIEQLMEENQKLLNKAILLHSFQDHLPLMSPETWTTLKTSGYEFPRSEINSWFDLLEQPCVPSESSDTETDEKNE